MAMNIFERTISKRTLYIECLISVLKGLFKTSLKKTTSFVIKKNNFKIIPYLKDLKSFLLILISDIYLLLWTLELF